MGVVSSKTFMRMVSIILTLTTMISTLGLGGIVQADTLLFNDIEGSYAKEQIGFLANENIFTGYQDGTFRPKQEVTRAELAKVLVYTLGLEEDSSAAEVFTDVPDHVWYKGVVGALVKSGITSGTSSTTFSPNKKVSREELAVFFVRAFQLEEKAKQLHLAADISDFEDVASWAKDSVALAFEIGYINGMKNEDGSYRFYPKGNTERQAIAKLAFGFYVNKEEFLNKALKVYDLHFGKKIVGINDDLSKVIFDDGLELGLTKEVKLILNKENEDILKDAVILYEQNENNEITAITQLILNTSGMAAETGQAEFSGNIVLDGNNGTINGDVVVKGDYTTLKNLTIKGDLYIDESVENDFKAVDVSVEGTSYVNGGDENTVVFVGSTLVNIEINNQNVRVQALTTNIQNAIMNANDSTLEGDSASSIISITIRADVTVTGELIIQEVIVESSNANVTLNTTEEIPNVTVMEEGIVLLGSSPIALLIVPVEGDVDNQLENEPGTTQDSEGNVVDEATPPSNGGYTPPRDTTPPTVIGVIDGNSYNVDVAPTFTEGTATLAKDGGTAQSYSSGTAITDEGAYVLVVTDEAGNVTSVNFTIDKTAPVVTGVEDGTTYNNNVIATFSEGTAILTWVGVGPRAYTSGEVIEIEGTYVLIVSDGTGNETIINFVIDKIAPAATISPTNIEYDLYSPGNVTTTINWNNSQSITKINDGSGDLSYTSTFGPPDYSAPTSANGSTGTLTINQSYFDRIGVIAGETITLSIIFSGLDSGVTEETFTINVIDTVVSSVVIIEEVTPSDNTVFGIDNIGFTVDVNTGVTVGDLKSAIQATDGSPQIYEVLNISNVLLDDTNLLADGYQLKVTAEDGTTNTAYTINVLSNMTTLGIATSNPADINEIDNTAGSETITMKNLSHTVGDLINSLTAYNINFTQTYEVTMSDGSTIKATTVVVMNGDKLIVTAENGVDTAAYTISMDTVAPKVTTIEYVDATHLRLTFDEPLDLITSEDEGNYTLSGALTGSAIVADRGGVDNKKVTIEVPSMHSMVDGDSVTVTVANVEDRSGNIVDTAENSQTYTKPTVQPSTVGVTLVDNFTLMVFFSEPVSESLATNVDTYLIDYLFAPEAAEFIGTEQNIVKLYDSFGITGDYLIIEYLTDTGGTVLTNNMITIPLNDSPAPTFSPSDGATNVAVNQSLTITFSGQVTMLDGTVLDNTNVDRLISLYDDTLNIPVVFDATVSVDGGNTVITVMGQQNVGPESGQNQQLLNGHDYTLSVGPAKGTTGIITLPATTTFTTMY